VLRLAATSFPPGPDEAQRLVSARPQRLEVRAPPRALVACSRAERTYHAEIPPSHPLREYTHDCIDHKSAHVKSAY